MYCPVNRTNPPLYSVYLQFGWSDVRIASVFVLTEALWDKFSVKAVRMNEDDDDDDDEEEEEEDAQGKTGNCAILYSRWLRWYVQISMISCRCFHSLLKPSHLTLQKMMTTMNEPYDNCV
jgi:hypothetical protein